MRTAQREAPQWLEHPIGMNTKVGVGDERGEQRPQVPVTRLVQHEEEWLGK
jgi:hypothetical protein